MEVDHDVIIAGGGFAGLAAAKSCAERGVDCVVFERSSEIGYPIHTSGGSSIPELKEMGIQQNLFHTVRNVEFISPSETATFEYHTPKFCVMDVRGVRQHLAERAIDAGAAIKIETKVVDTITENDERIVGVTIRDDYEQRDVHGSVTIDATGFQSIVAQNADLHNGFKRFGRGIEYDLFAPEYDSETVRLIVGERLIPSGYAWIFPYTENRIRVGVGSLFPDSETDLRKSMDQVFEDYHKFGLDRTAQIERHSGVIPSEGTPKRTVDDGVLLAGDAANFPFGVVGEGIRMALDTGQEAGRVAAKGVQANDTSRAKLRVYEDYWKTKYQNSLQISHWINRRLADFDDNQWDKGTRILQELDPEEFYHLLRSDFSKKRIFDLCRSHPRLLIPFGEELVKQGIIDRMPL